MNFSQCCCVKNPLKFLENFKVSSAFSLFSKPRFLGRPFAEFSAPFGLVRLRTFASLSTPCGCSPKSARAVHIRLPESNNNINNPLNSNANASLPCFKQVIKQKLYRIIACSTKIDSIHGNNYGFLGII